MSRSFKKHNVCGVGADSERWDKKRWHKKLRCKANQMCKYRRYDPDFVATDLPVVREVSNLWDMIKDGKMFISPDFVDPEFVQRLFTKKGKLRK